MEAVNKMENELISLGGHLLSKYGARLEEILGQHETFDSALASDPQEVIKCVTLSTLGGDILEHYGVEPSEVDTSDAQNGEAA